MRKTVKYIAVAALWFAVLANAHAKALSTFHGAIQFADGGQGAVINDGVYERYEYPFFGSFLTISTSALHGYNPDHGDTWVLELYNTKTQETDARIVFEYDAASDCLMHQDSPVVCGLYIPAGSPDSRTIALRIYLYGSCAGQHAYVLHGTTPERHESWAFTPTRFKPEVAVLNLPTSLAPTMINGTGGRATVSTLITDDLGCSIPLEDIDVVFHNTFVPGSGGHANITAAEAPITGYYEVIETYGGNVPESVVRSMSFPSGNPQSYTVAPKIEGKTNQLGWFQARYTAGIFGGEEKVKVTASIEHISDKDPAAETSVEKNLAIKVGDLVEMEREGEHHRFNFGGGCGTFNPDARWLTATNKERALILGRMWHFTYNEKLSYNDASLVNGGVIESKVIENGCHRSHRVGVDIDVNNSINQLKTDCSIQNGINVCRLDNLVRFADWLELDLIKSMGIHFKGRGN